MSAVAVFDRQRYSSRASARRTWRILPVVAMIVLPLLVACGGGGQPTATPPPATPTAVAATPTAVATPPALGEVTWASAIDPKTGAPATPVTSFLTTDKTIYAILKAPDLPKGATLRATWSFNGAPVPVPPQTVAITHEERSSWIEFHLTWAAGGTWPDGTLQIAISADGQPTRTASVAIKRPGGAIRDDVP